MQRLGWCQRCNPSFGVIQAVIKCYENWWRWRAGQIQDIGMRHSIHYWELRQQQKTVDEIKAEIWWPDPIRQLTTVAAIRYKTKYFMSHNLENNLIIGVWIVIYSRPRPDFQYKYPAAASGIIQNPAQGSGSILQSSCQLQDHKSKKQ